MYGHKANRIRYYSVGCFWHPICMMCRYSLHSISVYRLEQCRTPCTPHGLGLHRAFDGNLWCTASKPNHTMQSTTSNIDGGRSQQHARPEAATDPSSLTHHLSIPTQIDAVVHRWLRAGVLSFAFWILDLESELHAIFLRKSIAQHSRTIRVEQRVEAQRRLELRREELMQQRNLCTANSVAQQIDFTS